MPSAQFDHRTRIASPRHVVWEALQEADTYEGLGPVSEVSDATHREEILTGFRWVAHAGPRIIEGVATTRQALAPELMVFDLDAGDVTGLLTIELLAAGTGSEATVVLTMDASGILATLFFGVIRDTIAKDFPNQIDSLAARLTAA